MKIKEEIYHLIRNDVKLRMKIARYLGVTDTTVYGHCIRKAPKLMEYPVIKIIMKHTGKKESEVFDTEPRNHVKDNQ